MNHDVSAMIDGILKIWGQEGVVDNEQESTIVAERRTRVKVSNVHHGIRGRLNVQSFCGGGQCGFDRT